MFAISKRREGIYFLERRGEEEGEKRTIEGGLKKILDRF